MHSIFSFVVIYIWPLTTRLTYGCNPTDIPEATAEDATLFFPAQRLREEVESLCENAPDRPII